MVIIVTTTIIISFIIIVAIHVESSHGESGKWEHNGDPQKRGQVELFAHSHQQHHCGADLDHHQHHSDDDNDDDVNHFLGLVLQ